MKYTSRFGTDKFQDPTAWAVALCHEHTPTGPGCQPLVLDRHIYADPDAAATAGDYRSYSHMQYRAACYGCEWLSTDIYDDEGPATESAHDHAFPGWRDLPILPQARPDASPSQRAEVLSLIEKLYPAGWVERHGPILTKRSEFGTRHVPGYSPTGGYDLCGAIEAKAEPVAQVEQADLF